MNYLFYSILFCSIIGIIVIPLAFQYRLKLDFIGKKATQNILKQKPLLFSEYLVKKAVAFSVKKHSSEQINLLVQGNLLGYAKKIQKYKPVLAQLLKSFYNPLAAEKNLEKVYKKNTNDTDLAVWLALINEALNNKERAQLFWDKVTEQKISREVKAYYWMHIAQTAAKNGDLECASQYFYRVAAIFHRCKSFYEEGEVYLHLGTLYRISFIYDISEMLFLSALKRYKNLKHETGQAKTFANLGALMMGQERFEEAQDYFEKASEIYDSLQQNIELAEIKNQQALMYLLKKEYKKAENYANEAEKIHKKHQNLIGKAFSQEIKANVSWQQNDFERTSKLAAKAAEHYKESNQISGELESLYLQAQALFKGGKDKDSEKILRQILSQGKKDCGCFYLANAYNLLGIIYVKRRDLKRAKGLFQQSLDLEQRGVRINALAADYANMGLVEMHCGHKETARKNLETAVNLAKEIEDKELCSLLRHHLNKLNN